MTSQKNKKLSGEAKKKGIELSVVIVSYNVREFLEQCLLSVEKALQGIQAEVLVIDNASADDSVEIVRRKFPSIKLLVNQQNLGFAKASNVGLKRARGQFIALLNPDTIVQQDTFEKMLGFFKEHPEAGMAGCKILNPNGTLQLACRRSFPTPWVAFTKLSGLSRLFPRSKIFGRYNLTYLNPNASYEVEAISGSFMIIRRELLQTVGYFDDNFFMYGEDLDWCYRIREHGWQVWYFPKTQIIHFKGESSKRAQFDSLRQFYLAMELFARKHFTQKYLFMPYWLLRGAIWLRGSLSFVLKLVTSQFIPITDFALLNASLVLALYIRFGALEHLKAFLPVIVFYSFIWMFVLKIFGCYDRDKFSVSRSALAIFIGFLMNASLTFFFKQYAFSRAVVLGGGGLSLLTVSGWRLLIKILSLSTRLPFRGAIARNTIIVGDLESSAKLAKKFTDQTKNDYNISGLVTLNGMHTGKLIDDVKVLGGLDKINSVISENRVQEVIFSTQHLSYDQILEVVANSDRKGVNFKLIPSNLDVVIGKASIDRLDEFPLLTIDYKLHQSHYRMAKRTLDFSLAFLLFFLTLPLFLYKKILTSNQLKAKIFLGRNNSNLLLHEFSGGKSFFNKIPYFWSILKGELSFVGEELVEVSDHSEVLESDKYDLKPGLVPLYHLSNKLNIGAQEKQKYRIYYMKNYSPFLDLKILYKAFFLLPWISHE